MKKVKIILILCISLMGPSLWAKAKVGFLNKSTVKIFYCTAKGSKIKNLSPALSGTDIYAVSMDHALAQAATFFWNHASHELISTRAHSAEKIWTDIVCIRYP